MLLEHINNLEIFRPKCDSTKEVLHAIADFATDISMVLPYLNAELGGWENTSRAAAGGLLMKNELCG